MSDKPGEFTQKFDAEIFNKKLEEHQNSGNSEVEEKLNEIQARLDKRKKFLLERFSNAEDENLAPGLALNFKRSEEHTQKAHVQFKIEHNPTTGAVFIRYELKMDPEGSKQDYITISLKKFDINKVEKFIESKILQFARTYVQGS